MYIPYSYMEPSGIVPASSGLNTNSSKAGSVLGSNASKPKGPSTQIQSTPCGGKLEC